MFQSFYVRGFLYHLPSQKILLQQNPDLDCGWSLIGEEGFTNQNPEVVFHKLISTVLKTIVLKDTIYPVYDYTKENGVTCFVFYVESDLKDRGGYAKDSKSQWFSFHQVTKLSISEQMKQDIVVAERVIDAKARDNVLRYPG